MEIKNPQGLMNKDLKRVLNRQHSQSNLREKGINNQNILTIEQEFLPRANSNACFSSFQQLEGLGLKTLNPARKNLEPPKQIHIPSFSSVEKLETTQPSDRKARQENDYYVVNPSNKNRVLRPQQLRKSNDAYCSGSLTQKFHGDSLHKIPLREQNSQFYKRSFERLLSFFKTSNSKNPGPIFTESDQPDSIGMLPTAQSQNITPVNNIRNRKSLNVPKQFNTDPGETDRNENNTDQVYIERVIYELFAASGAKFSWRILDADLAKAMNKKKEEYWDELLMQYVPTLVEILVVDTMGLVVRRHIELSIITAEIIATKVEEYIRQENLAENQALHLLVYFHHGGNQKTLVLNKYCFYFAKNGNFQEDLKSEKDVVIFYFLMLGLCHLRITLENEPLKKIKISGLKERAFAILKGNEVPPKIVLEWLQARFNNFAIVEKVFFNLNNGGTILSAYVFNIRNYMKSRHAKLLLQNDDSNSSLQKKSISIKKINITQRSTGSYIRRIPISLANISPLRNQAQSLSRRQNHNSIPTNNAVKNNLLTLRKPKPLDQKDEVTDIKLNPVLQTRIETASPKIEIPIPKLEMRTSKRHKTPTLKKKMSTKLEPLTLPLEKNSSKPNILDLKAQENGSNLTPKSRQLKLDPYPKFSQEPLSPWHGSSTPIGFDSVPKRGKVNGFKLQDLAEEQIKDYSDHSSSLRQYLTAKDEGEEDELN